MEWRRFVTYLWNDPHIMPAMQLVIPDSVTECNFQPKCHLAAATQNSQSVLLALNCIIIVFHVPFLLVLISICMGKYFPAKLRLCCVTLS